MEKKSDAQQKPEAARRPRFLRLWFFVLAGLSIAAVYFYQQYQQRQDQFLNTDYFRTLHEASATLDARLDQFHRLTRFGENEGTIRVLFPSYEANYENPQDCDLDTMQQLTINGKRIEFTFNRSSSEGGSESGQLESSVRPVDTVAAPESEELPSAKDSDPEQSESSVGPGDNVAATESDELSSANDSEPLNCVSSAELGDILPAPKSDFTLYLLASADNKVLSHSGDGSTLSIVNTLDISRQIQQRSKQSWLNFSTAKPEQTATQNPSLPGYSYNLDMKLTSGASRLFIYPFEPALNLSPKVGSNQDNDAVDLSRLYLIGVVPENNLEMKGSLRWNLSLLLISLVLLVFIWALLRLVMMSRNQPVSEVFYRCTMICSYALFVLVAALLFSYGEQSLDVRHKQHVARQLMNQVQGNLDAELYDIFARMEGYRSYYQKLLAVSLDVGSKDKTVQYVADALAGKQNRELKEALTTFSGAGPGLPKAQGDEIQLIALGDGQRFDLGNDDYRHARSMSSDCVSFEENALNNKDPLDFINIYGQGAKFLNDHECGERFSAARMNKSDKQRKLLQVFLMDDTAQQVLPTFYYIESNKEPVSYNLSHRDYFKKVRNQEGWSATFSPGNMTHEVEMRGGSAITKPNFYIQRLLNVNNGARGTTLGMPLFEPGEQESDDTKLEQHYGKVMGADIVLSSLTLTEYLEPDKLLDLVIMVVDEDSGKVLFHMDDDRSMVENLFNTGQGTGEISQMISTGRGTGDKLVPGYYHGTAGMFMTEPLAIEQWALVVFFPAINSAAYMTNVFLINSLTMGFALGSVALFIFILHYLADTGVIKTKLGIPLVINRRKIVIFSSIYIAAIYLGYWLGAALDRTGVSHQLFYSLLFPVVAMLLCLAWGLFEYLKYFGISRQAKLKTIRPLNGAAVLTVVFLIGGCLLTLYVHRIGPVPVAAMDWYYTEDLYPARLNQEAHELQKIALTRYPNSITRYQTDPLELVPVSQPWRCALSPMCDASHKGGHLKPTDVGHFDQLTYNSTAADWIRRFLLPKSMPNMDNKQYLRAATSNWFYVLMVSLFVIFSAAWVSFNRRVLSVRLFGSPEFLRHLNQSCRVGSRDSAHCPDDHLVIDLKHSAPVGLGLDVLLGRRELGENSSPEFEQLTQLCPLLAHAVAQNSCFPCMKIHLEKQERGLSLQLWDVEECLARQDHRRLLLNLLNQLKSLRVEGSISQVTIYLGFSSMERLLLKPSRLDAEGAGHEHLDAGECASWAECLMDFNVLVPDEVLDHVDSRFVQQECSALPMVGYLQEELLAAGYTQAHGPFNEQRWLELKDWQKTHSEWASINYMLLKVGAIYRDKWESCSAAEKLALYYLALGKRINPSNTQMLQQLALEGLIKIRRGRIRIVNKSFAYFVQHAEDSATLQQLVSNGDAGAWQDYRAPVTLLILLAIGAIALTSGNSLYMIVASMVGMLGTIGTLTNSARLIQDNIKK